VKRLCLAAQQRARKEWWVATLRKKNEVTKDTKNPRKRLYKGVIRRKPAMVGRPEKVTGLKEETQWRENLVFSSVEARTVG
jgi:hypothetical protein